jgi:putative heme-binding domain-containing protein
MMHMRHARSGRFPLVSLICALFLANITAPELSAANLVPVPALGLRIAQGFRVTLYADSDLANDIYAMTLDAQGNPVVTSEGYVRRLLDRNGDGVADAYEDIAPTKTGGMGMLLDGNNLYFTGDKQLSVLEDAEGSGRNYGKPRALLPVNFTEHGGHAVRKGPDGWLYFIGGNDSGFGGLPLSGTASPIKKIEAGALLRISPDGTQIEAVAHGFRNPYDFDFNWMGDIFTYDSDVERDFFLPWYSPTRAYHVGFGQHHGWRLEGFRRSWARQDYYADTVDILAPLGRGSPTGVAVYRHHQFPAYYRNGFFALDWTFGKVFFLNLQPSGASYQSAPEVFLEPIGTQGFAPTDIVVTPEGSLLISIGGRKTRGAIYKIDFSGGRPAEEAVADQLLNSLSEVRRVLEAPQPLEAWSRAQWEPLARKLGAEPFAQAMLDQAFSSFARVRAVEVLTELFGGLSEELSQTASRANLSFVRARVAWSLGRHPNASSVSVLLALSRDPDLMVRRSALEALTEQAANLNNIALQQAIGPNLGLANKRVRMAAARLATHLPEVAWKALSAQSQRSDAQTRLSVALVSLWRDDLRAVNPSAIQTALEVLTRPASHDLQLQAVRIVMLGMGDYHLHEPSLEAYTGYETAFSLGAQPELLAKIRKSAGALLPSGDDILDTELGRLLAMVSDDNPQTSAKALNMITLSTSPTSDFHWLTVLSRLQGPVPTNNAARVAHTVLSLERKLAGLELRTKQNWTTRLAEISQRLMERDSKVADAMLRHPDFVSPAHLVLVPSFNSEQYQAAARRFALEVRKNPRFTWTGPLIDLLDSLPAAEARPLLRQQWPNIILRDEILLELAKNPEPLDREKLVQGLASTRMEVVRASIAALRKLPTQSPDGLLLPAYRLLRRVVSEPKETKAREELLGLLSQVTGQKWNIQEPSEKTPATLQKSYQPPFAWFAQRYPSLAKQLDENTNDDVRWNALLKNVAWNRGDAQRGSELFRERGCQTCHAATSAVGPDLAGVTERFSPNDLFNAILYPSRDVAGPYRMEIFQMRDGTFYNGIVAFESADGVILRTSATSTIRLNDSEILSRQPSMLSLMPAGLLEGFDARSIADLYSYLKTLQTRSGN